MYKKVCCTCKAVVLLILTYCFFDILIVIATVTYLTPHWTYSNACLELSQFSPQLIDFGSSLIGMATTFTTLQFVVIQKMCCNVMYQLLLSIDHLVLMWVALYFLFTPHNELTMRTQAEEKEGHFCGEICTYCLCFHDCYLPPLPTTQPHPPPPAPTEQLC